MTRLLPTRRFLRNSGLFLAVAVFACAWSRSVEASCGDYVMIGGHSSKADQHASGPSDRQNPILGSRSLWAIINEFRNHHWDQLAAAKLRDLTKLKHATPGSSGGRDHSPCHGPMCSQQRSLPPLAPPVQLRAAIDQFATLSTMDRVDSFEIRSLPFLDSELGFRQTVTSRIFRPPRA